MHALAFHEFGAAEVLRCEQRPDPAPDPRQALSLTGSDMIGEAAIRLR